MKKLIPTIAIAICSLGMTSYSNAQQLTSKAVQADIQVKTDQTKQTSREQPKVGTVKSMVTGDLMCYLTLVDENNVEHQVGADFDICVNKNTYLNRKVRLSYKLVSINDCQSAEPCGRTRKEWLVTKMELVGEGNPQRR